MAAPFITGLAAAGLGYLSLQQLYWKRAETIAKGLQEVQAGVEGGKAVRVPVADVHPPELPFPSVREVLAPAEEVVVSLWNAGVLSLRSTTISAMTAYQQDPLTDKADRLWKEVKSKLDGLR